MGQRKTVWQILWAGVLLVSISVVDASSGIQESAKKSNAGQISGMVFDVNGAIVLGARVVFESEQGTHETNSNEDGYAINLPAGSYRTMVTAPWFCPVGRPSFGLSPSASLRFNFVLTPCPIVHFIIVEKGQYKGEGARLEPPFHEEVVRLKSGLDLLMRFGTRDETRKDGLVQYRATSTKQDNDLPATAMIDLLTVYADNITLDRKRSTLIAEGHVVIDDSKERVYAARAEIVLERIPAMAQIRKRSVCGRVVNIPDGVARTEALLYFGPGGFDELLPGVVAEPNGAFCVENYVRDLTERTSARLYVTSFCRPDDVTLVNVPFWPRMRREPGFSGKPIVVGPMSVTTLADVDVQVMYGHITLRILDRHHLPLLTEQEDWSPIWIRVRDQNGVTVHESGLSVVEIERAVDLRESRINFALPKGTWTLEIALAGVPPDTVAIRRTVKWLRVPGKLRIESCAKPVDVAVSVSRPTRS